MSKLSKAIFCGAAVLCGAPQAAETVRDKVYFLTFENDTYFYTDRYYTNGIQFSAKTSADKRGDFARKLTRSLCRFVHCDDTRLLTSQSNLGQLMYTPRDITVAAPQPNDRAWGGLLYYEQAYTFLSADQRVLTTLSGQVGVTGQPSLAEPAQKLFHRIFDRPPPAGWHNQIGNSIAAMASAERRTAREALSFDISSDVRLNTATYWRVGVGNIQTYAAAGVAIVIGKDLPSVSPPPPGIGTKMTTGDARRIDLLRTCMVRWIQCTGFGAVETRLVANNLFLDGRLFKDDPSVKKRRVVVDLMAGMRFDFPNTRTAGHGPWFAQFKVTRRSPEFRSTFRVPSQTVGALTIGTEF